MGAGMCFSASADLVGGLVITAIGLDAVRHTSRPPDRLVAALPLVLGPHQLVEAAVWWGLDGRLSPVVWRAALGLYLTVAFGVLPVLVPLTVAGLEPAYRRWRTAAFVGLRGPLSIVS